MRSRKLDKNHKKNKQEGFLIKNFIVVEIDPNNQL
mgnify:CR=1 FL=1